MDLERWIRLVAGSFILIRPALAVWVNQWWLLFTAFVGANLIQPPLFFSRNIRVSWYRF